MTKREPLPLIGVRGSETAVSAPKALVAVGAIMLGASTVPGEALSPVERVSAPQQGLGAALEALKRSAAYSWKSGHGKAAAAALGAMILFGKSIDKRLKGFPVKFGK